MNGMQTTPAAQAPAATQSTPVIVTPGTAPIAFPRTVQELQGLRAKRSELSSQLSSAAGRRQRLVREANRLPAGPSRSGLEQRVAVLDQRIVQIETDMAETGRQLATTQAGILSTQEQQISALGGLRRSDVTEISSIFIIFVLAPLALVAARNMWKRGNRPPPLPPDVESARRIEQLQQSVDTIAIEMERVSEGQRFVTKLLSEQPRVPSIQAVNDTVLEKSQPPR